MALTAPLIPWDTLTNNEKLDRLTIALTRAGSDLEFRERCLRSSESAKEAVSEVTDIAFPDDFKLEFVTAEERMKRLILTMPDYIEPEDGVPEVRNAEEYQPCTYLFWRS